MATQLTKEQKDTIQKAVEKAEASTIGEIVPILLKQSDNYPAAHFRGAIFFSFLPPLLLYYSPLDIPDPMIFIWSQLAGLIVGHLLVFFPKLKRLFSTRKELSEEVHQRALQAFLNNGLHTTRDRTGILIMVSLLEHRVEILADTGINEKVPPRTWRKVITPLTKKIRHRQITEGLCEAITQCGDILAQYFPLDPDVDDENELPNALVTEESHGPLGEERP